MSRGLVWLIALMAIVVTALGLGIWWIGPTLANLAFVDGRRGDPYAVLDLVQAPDAQRYDSRYRAPLGELVRSEAGAALADYRLHHLVSGKVADEWHRLRLLDFSAATDFVRVLTSSPYRLLVENLGARRLKLGSFERPAASWRSVLVVGLLDAREGVSPLAPLLARLAATDGTVVWDAPVAALEREASWNRVIVVDFPDTAGALAWLRSEDALTEITLAKTRADALVLAVYVADSP